MKKKSCFGQTFDWIKQIIVILIAAVLVSMFLFQPFEVRGRSMEPTFAAAGEKVLVFKTPYFFNAVPQYGDIIIVDNRVHRERNFMDYMMETALLSALFGTDNEHIWIKRVIGLPEDQLEYRDGQVYRNGVLLDEDYIKENMINPFRSIIVPENHVFVMGDNRNYSSDSRQLGPVPLGNIQGKVFLKYSPFSEIRTY